MPDPKDQQQQPVQYQLPEGYDSTQVVENQPAKTTASAPNTTSGVVPPTGYENHPVIPGDTTAIPPVPKESWGRKVINTIGNLVPESAPAAAQKAQETIGEAVPQWSVKPLAAFEKYVNEPLNAAAAWGAKQGRRIGLEELTSQDPERNVQGVPFTTEQAEKKYPVTSGVVGTAGEMVGGMVTDPRAWPFLGSGAARPVLQKALSGGFGTMMTKDTADAATELMATWDDITPEQRAQLAARAGLSGVMATLSAAHLAPETAGKIVKGAKAIGGDLMKGEEGHGPTWTARGPKKGAPVTGAEQFEPRNLPKSKGTELPAAADRAPYIEPTPAGPEPGLVGPDYTQPEPDVLPRQGKLPFPQGQRMEYAQPTPTGPGPEVATGAGQFDIQNLPRQKGALEFGESQGPKAPVGLKPTEPKYRIPYGTIDVESMTSSKEAGFPEAKVEEKPITPGEVKSSPGTSMGEERRATGGERRTSTEPYQGEERRQAERRASLSTPTEVEQSMKTGKPVKTAFDVTEGAMDTIKRDQAMPKHPAEEAKVKNDAIVKHIESGKDFAILQAENPQNTRISDAENTKLTAQLKQELIDKGYKPVEVGGNTKDVEGVQEHAFYVPDISAKDAAELGKKYKQQGIVTHEGLRDLNTDKTDPLDLSKGLVKGDKAREQQYYTTIGGEDYHFPITESKEAQNPTRASADNVNKALGKTKVNNEKVDVSPNRRAIADAYDAMKHDPTNPKVKASYDAFKKETVDQWKELEKQGYKLEPSKEDPYKSFEDMAKDVKDNKRIKVWTGGEPPADHPMSEVDPESGLTYNTIFRAVHDIMGHAAGDNDFTEVGEENAWKRHVQSYSDAAVPAMTTDSKGQTSAYFNAPDVRNGADPHFPEQKANLIPKEYYTEAPKAETKTAAKTGDVEADKLKDVAKPDRDTKDILQKVQQEPEWKSKNLSEQLREAGRRAEVAEAGLEGETNSEDDARVKQHVFELGNANLKKLIGAMGLDPDAYDFSKREVPEGRTQKQPVERNKAITDVMAKLTPEQISQIGEQSRAIQSKGTVGGEPERNFKSRAEQSEGLLKSLWEGKETQPKVAEKKPSAGIVSKVKEAIKGGMDVEAEKAKAKELGREFKVIPIADLDTEHLDVPRMTDQQKADLVDSVKKHGLREAVNVGNDDNGELRVLDGSHRVRAAMEAGLTEIPVAQSKDPWNMSKEPKHPYPDPNKIEENKAAPSEAKHDTSDPEVRLYRTYGDNTIYNDKGKYFVEGEDGVQHDFDTKQQAVDFAKGEAPENKMSEAGPKNTNQFPKMSERLAQFKGKGPAPEATAETAKMSPAELKKAGFTQSDIDAGKHLPEAGGGGEGETSKMAGMEKIPENITKQFRDDEIAGLKTEVSQKKAAQQLMKVPAVQEWVDVANLGAGERRWYQRGTAAAKAIAELLPQFFDKEGDTDKFLNVVASLSPRQAIAENFTEALRVWKELKEAEKAGIDLNEKLDTKRPVGYPKDEDWTRAGKIMWDNIGMNRKAKIPNALSALSGKSALEMWPDLKDNRYFKVPSFAANLAGFLDKVTSDGWMAAFAGLGENELSNPSSYHPLAVMTRAAADELGWEPAEAQAAIWAAVKTLTEKGTVTPEGIRQYSQDFADIVKGDHQIREMLTDMGVDLEKLDEKLNRIEAKPEVTSRGTPTTEDSVGKLTKRLEKQGREIPEGTPIEREADANRIRELSQKKPSKLGRADEDTSFNPEEFGGEEKKERPITDSLLNKYGTTEDAKGAAQFITEDGKRIPVQDHDEAVKSAKGKKKVDPADRENYINDENSVRMRYRTGKGGTEVVFSVPKDVSESQIKEMKSTVKAMGPYGVLHIEDADPTTGNYASRTNARPAEVDDAIKELRKPKWSPMVKAFHVGGEE